MRLPATASFSPLRLAVTLGDPAGIGPEIILRLFAREGNFQTLSEKIGCPIIPFVVGETRHLEQIAEILRARESETSFSRTALRIESRDTPPSESPGAGVVPVVPPLDFRFPGELEIGKVSASCGAAAWAYMRHATALVQRGEADAVVTAPLHKRALQAAGCPYAGHTEMLADLAGGARVAMLLVGGGLRVALATIHEPISRVPRLLTREGILENLRLLDRFIPWFGWESGDARPEARDEKQKVCRRARIGVTGLNPHAGEEGLFGQEEREVIAPAIEAARAEGINAIGPLPGDTVFYFHREGAYDAVLAMYHDQALIPVKTLAFHDGVNVTMGLPFIRTSVDHGTAFDIAGKGIARPDSLRAALECAATLVKNRRLS